MKKKTLKERLTNTKEKAKTWVNEHGDAVTKSCLSIGIFVAGAVAYKFYDDIKYGNKTVSWYDHYLETEDEPECVAFTRTPTVNAIKKGVMTGKFSCINFNKKDIEELTEEIGGWDENPYKEYNKI